MGRVSRIARKFVQTCFSFIYTSEFTHCFEIKQYLWPINTEQDLNTVLVFLYFTTERPTHIT